MQNSWEVLDQALCSPRFARLKLLKVDYVLIDSEPRQKRWPRGYPEIVEERVVSAGPPPNEWLFYTRKIFPRVVARDKIRLEGRVIRLLFTILANGRIDYSVATPRCQYP